MKYFLNTRMTLCRNQVEVSPAPYAGVAGAVGIAATGEAAHENAILSSSDNFLVTVAMNG